MAINSQQAVVPVVAIVTKCVMSQLCYHGYTRVYISHIPRTLSLHPLWPGYETVGIHCIQNVSMSQVWLKNRARNNTSMDGELSA